MTWAPANAIYRKETHDNYPAAKAILHCVYEGLQVPFDEGLLIEARWFTNILRTKEAAAMIRSLFISMGELNKGLRRPKGVPPSNLKKIGVVGAGLMGAGIANAARERRPVGGAGRSQPGGGRQRQGQDRQDPRRFRRQGPAARRRARRAARPHRGDRRLRGAEGRGPRGRGRVRGTQRQERRRQAGAGRGRRPTSSTPPTPRRCRSPRSPAPTPSRRISSASTSSRPSRGCGWSRSSSARRPGTRRSPPRSTSSPRSRRRRSWCATPGASTPTAASAPSSPRDTPCCARAYRRR